MISFDYFFRISLNYLKYLTVRIIEFPFYVKYSLFSIKNYPTDFKKIALICTKPSGIGDLIMDTPFIKTIRNYFRHSEIHLITDKDVFDKVSELDRIILLKTTGVLTQIKEFFKLRKRIKYDLGVVMNRGVNQTIYLEILNPKFKIGYLAGWRILANFKLKKTNLSFTKKEHYWNMALKIAKSLGVKKLEQELIEVDFSKKIKQKVKDFVRMLKLDKNKKTLVINPFAKWKTRMWKEDNYIKLIEDVHKNFNIILYGGHDAQKSVEYILKRLNKKKIHIKSVAGRLNLKEAVYFLKFADLFITSDTGPMHFAFLMRTPTLALFGPVNPYHRLPKGFKKIGIYDYLWFQDFKPIKRLYNYEFEYINPQLNWLEAIPVEAVENKIFNFFERNYQFAL